MLMTHYREPIDFSVARLEEAESKLVSWQRAAKANDEAAPDPAAVAELADDLNFVRVGTVLDGLARNANRGDAEAAHTLAATLNFLGLPVDSLLTLEGDSGEIEAKVEARLAALNSKDFAQADAIRAELLAEGIQLMDYKDPETGERRTKWEVKR